MTMGTVRIQKVNFDGVIVGHAIICMCAMAYSLSFMYNHIAHSLYVNSALLGILHLGILLPMLFCFDNNNKAVRNSFVRVMLLMIAIFVLAVLSDKIDYYIASIAIGVCAIVVIGILLSAKYNNMAFNISIREYQEFIRRSGRLSMQGVHVTINAVIICIVYLLSPVGIYCFLAVVVAWLMQLAFSCVNFYRWGYQYWKSKLFYIVLGYSIVMPLATLLIAGDMSMLLCSIIVVCIPQGYFEHVSVHFTKD